MDPARRLPPQQGHAVEDPSVPARIVTPSTPKEKASTRRLSRTEKGTPPPAAAVPPLLAARLRQLHPDKLLGPLWAAHAQRDRPAVGLEEELEGEEAAATPLGDDEAD